MSPFWNVIHDKRQFTFPGNCLEMVEEPVLASRVIVRGVATIASAPASLASFAKAKTFSRPGSETPASTGTLPFV